MTLVKQQKVEALKAKEFRFSVDHLTPDQFSRLVDVLHDFRHVFATELHEMPGLKDCQYDIQVAIDVCRMNVLGQIDGFAGRFFWTRIELVAFETQYASQV